MELMLIDTIRKVLDGAGNGGILGEPDVFGKGKNHVTHTHISRVWVAEKRVWGNDVIYTCNMYVCVYIYDMHA